MLASFGGAQMAGKTWGNKKKGETKNKKQLCTRCIMHGQNVFIMLDGTLHSVILHFDMHYEPTAFRQHLALLHYGLHSLFVALLHIPVHSRLVAL